jgi:hypothetical protein
VTTDRCHSRRESRGGPLRGSHVAILDEYQYRDTDVEVIDPRTGSVVASRRWEKNAFLAPDRIGTIETGDDHPPLHPSGARILATSNLFDPDRN